MSTRYHGTELSGRAYVPAIYHDEPLDESVFMKLPIRKPKNCNHGRTICATWTCVESWAIDHHILFARTSGGRELAKAVGWNQDQLLKPDPAHPMPAPTVPR